MGVRSYAGSHVKLDKNGQKWTRRTDFETVSHRHMWFIIEAVTCVATRQDINKDKTSINLEKMGNSKSKYSIFGQKTLNIGIFQGHTVSQELPHWYWNVPWCPKNGDMCPEDVYLVLTVFRLN